MLYHLKWKGFVFFITFRIEDDKPQLPMYQVSKEKAKALGVDFIPLEVSLRDTVESLKEKSFFNI